MPYDAPSLRHPGDVSRTCGAVSLGLLLSRSLLELRLAEIQHRARTSIQTHLLLLGETKHGETVLYQSASYNAQRCAAEVTSSPKTDRPTDTRLTASFPGQSG